MTRPTQIVFYKDRDNGVELTLMEDSVALTESQMETITEMEIKFNDSYYSSTDYPSSFDWVTYKAEGKAVLKLGTILPSGSDRKTELIVYDAGNTNGIVWTQLWIKVSDEAEA